MSWSKSVMLPKGDALGEVSRTWRDDGVPSDLCSLIESQGRRMLSPDSGKNFVLAIETIGHLDSNGGSATLRLAWEPVPDEG